MNYENGSENQFKKATTGTFGSLLMDSVWSIPCIDLLALADAAVTTKGSGGCYGGVAGHQGGDSEQDANTQFQNQAGESSLMPISQTNGVKYLFDLNSPPTFPEPHLITTIPSELTPITPKQTRRAVRNRVVSDILNSKVDGRKDHVALNLKQSEPIIEQSQEDIWQLEESEGFEEGSSDDSILHKTPQPKPKRRKHRPKVVIEGQSKKSTTPKSNGSSTGKRKNIIPEKSTVRSTRNSCRRKLNFEDERMSQKAFSVSPITPNKAQIEMDAINKRLRAKRSLKFSEKIHEKDKEASNALNRNDSTCNTRADATLEAILSMTTNFPEIFKKKRSGKFYNSVTCNEIPSKWYPEMSTMNDVKNQQYYKNMLGFADVDIVRKKRSKGTKRVRDMGSFDGMVECKRLYMCMEALATADFSLNISTKKRTKRNSSIVSSSSYYNHWFLPNYLGFHSSLRWKNRYYDIDDIDVMINQFENLSINKQNVELDKHALVPYLTRYQGKKGLVQYEQNRSLVPFSGVKLKKERPKVDLDDETNRVWRLLLEDINSEGIDGINEDQTKRWEEERNVFSGRAASFIARMHLIQGDRRFSRWKGSVVDSVIGVFLTQNVSDHLSSSAFMNLAAKYPLASKSSNEADVNDVFNYIEMTEERTIMQNKHEDKCGSDESEISAESKTVSYKEGEIFEFQTVSGNSMIVTDQSEITEATELYSNGHDNLKISAIDSIKVKKGKTRKARKIKANWDSLRKNAKLGKKRERSTDTMDSVDYEAVRRANVNEISDIIKDRGMNNMLAERIKAFLNRLVRDHGSIDLEWLRDVPPDKAKEYLLSFRGLGLKSVECVRLLTLHHLAFPVDTNVGRIAVRLGWVPLQPLPESLQLHLLEMYPILESIQKYLWPRLCKLDQRTLYELHYQMITFGKVFCTKNKPNCNSCPMRGECRHFASAFASARLALPAPEEKRIVPAFIENKSAGLSQSSAGIINLDHLALPPANHHLHQLFDFQNQDPAIEEPTTPEPIIEIPATPESEKTQEFDIEDFFEDAEEIPMIRLNMEEFTQNLQNYMQNSMEVAEGDMSRALVALTSEAASIPTPKLKNISQLRTEHQVYELPDSHPLLEGLDKREPDDPCPYLLALWMPGETAESIQPPKGQCSSQESGTLCHKETCFWCSSVREANSQTVRGTLLIPCRTAMRGSFPLNGTYFQVNEVFADHESSLNPTDIPRSWLWNLPRRTVYFGTSIPTIFRGLTTEGIQHCFWRGFVCVRGFDQKTRAPRPLLARLHFPASKLRRSRGRPDDETEE